MVLCFVNLSEFRFTPTYIVKLGALLFGVKLENGMIFFAGQLFRETPFEVNHDLYL